MTLIGMREWKERDIKQNLEVIGAQALKHVPGSGKSKRGEMLGEEQFH